MKHRLMIMLALCLALFVGWAPVAEARAKTIAASSEYTTVDLPGVAPFTALMVDGQTEVEFWQSTDNTYAVSLYGPKNLVDLVEVYSKDGVLAVHYKEPLVVLGDHHLRVAVMAPGVERVTVKQSGEVKFTGPLQVQDLTISVGGKGEVDFDAVTARAVRVDVHEDGEVDVASLTCDSLQVDAKQTASFDAQQVACDTAVVKAANRGNVSISGLNGRTVTAESHQSAEVELKGKVGTAMLTALGRSELDAGSLQAQNADVMAESSARIDVRVSDTLNAQTQGRGVVEYKGWPKQINRSGKGTVKQEK